LWLRKSSPCLQHHALLRASQAARSTVFLLVQRPYLIYHTYQKSNCHTRLGIGKIHRTAKTSHPQSMPAALLLSVSIMSSPLPSPSVAAAFRTIRCTATKPCMPHASDSLQSLDNDAMQASFCQTKRKGICVWGLHQSQRWPTNKGHDSHGLWMATIPH
jgi:hypothetical protein